MKKDNILMITPVRVYNIIQRSNNAKHVCFLEKQYILGRIIQFHQFHKINITPPNNLPSLKVKLVFSTYITEKTPFRCIIS